MAGIVAAALLTGFWCFLAGRLTIAHLPELLAGRRSGSGSGGLKERIIEMPFMRVIEYAMKQEPIGLLLNSYHMKLFILRGSSWTMERTKKETASAIGIGYGALTGCAWLSGISGEALLLAAGLLAFIGLGFRGFADAGKQVNRRRKAIIAALPDRMSKLMLLVGAGETVQSAFARCLEGKENSQNPLDQEWRAAVAAMRNGQSFNTALERFNRSCAVQEASLFTTVMLLNYRKGGEHFVLAVRELSYSLWEKRKEIARVSGEEASSKLVFPLVGILFIMMILVAAPAVLMMS